MESEEITNSAQSIYSINGPGSIHSNLDYNVAISLHQADVASEIKVGIEGPSYNEHKTIELQPMSTQNVEFKVPKLEPGQYKLIAEGLKGVVFSKSIELNFAETTPLIFIQTNKATYKPGDLVQFRVLFLDHKTRPAKISENITILINDGERNRLKQWTNIELSKGVYSDKFQLSEQPVLGMWSIEVNVGELMPAESKQFEVAKYVLPKFKVRLETDEHVPIQNGVIKATVSAQYTYGKCVKGKATVSIQMSRMCNAQANTTIAEKTIDVIDNGHVEFDIVKDLNILHNNLHNVLYLDILAIMEEDLTGNKYNASATITLHSEQYQMESVLAPNTFRLHEPIVYKMVVKNWNGTPVQDSKESVQLSLQSQQTCFGLFPEEKMLQNTSQSDVALVFEAKLNEHGIATFNFEIGEQESHRFSAVAKYKSSMVYLPTLIKYSAQYDADDNVPLALKLHTSNPVLTQPLTVELKSNEQFSYFVYSITGRGNILQAARIDLPKPAKSYNLTIQPSFEMVPQAQLFVHFVNANKDLKFCETRISFEKNFANKLEITLPVETKPGENVSLSIKTDPGSYVGLLGVDQSVLLLKSGNDLNKEQIFNKLDAFKSHTPWRLDWGAYPGKDSGLVTLTNANFEFHRGHQVYYMRSSMQFMPLSGAGLFPTTTVAMASMFPGTFRTTTAHSFVNYEQTMPIIVRKNFVDSWIFDEMQNSADGSMTLVKQIPDTITSWVITGFSLNPETGLALTEDATKIRVFQPFFLSTNLPYSVKRGEVIAIQVVVFNYMDKSLDAEVSMSNEDGDYEFVEASNEVDEQAIDAKQRTKRLTVPSNTGSAVSMLIRPKRVGDIALRINAITPLAGDAIRQTLKVEAEGVTHYENRAVFVNLKDAKAFSEKLQLNIPADAVPDSEFIEFTVVGDLLGPTITNLDKLVRMPYGCGEQNMVNFVPNILVLKYLYAIGQHLPTVEERAKKFMEIGYQRELTYKHDDGSYSAFGKTDKAGSTWLTAYVMRSFQQAAEYIDIDAQIMQQGLAFLASTQAQNGSFVEHGKLFDNANQNELGLTAYVLLAFLANPKTHTKYQTEIDKGMQYLHSNIEKCKDQYALAIAALALQLGAPSLASKAFGSLEKSAKQANDHKWWSNAEEQKSSEPAWWVRTRSKDVETTAYVLLALLERNSAEHVLPIIKWLITQRNSNGGFESTQDTVVGLQALIKFAQKTGSGSGVMNIDYQTATGNTAAVEKGSVQVNADNALVMQTHVLSRRTRQVDFTANGNGSSLVQLSYRYNLADKDKKPSFKLKTKVQDNAARKQLNLDVCAEYVPLEEAKKETLESNMVVVEVNLPSGYTAETERLAAIEGVVHVKRTETKNVDTTVIIYFDSLTAGEVVCLPLEATKSHAVAKQKPASISIYDYYDTTRRATEYYEVSSSLCDICEGEDCGNDCKNLKKMA